MSTNVLLQTAQAKFAFNLIRETGMFKSTVISPASISVALGMTLIGAKNNTAAEIQNAIARGIPSKDIHQHFSFLNSKNEKNVQKGETNETKNLKILDPFTDHEAKEEPKSGFKIVNKIYFAKDLEILETYKNLIHQYYGENFQCVDFAKSVEVANEINKFISDSTDNEIRNMVNSKMFDQSLQMLLVNAVYFEKLWKYEKIKRFSSKTF